MTVRIDQAYVDEQVAHLRGEREKALLFIVQCDAQLKLLEALHHRLNEPAPTPEQAAEDRN